MRHWLIILLIALLPVRGWTASSMLANSNAIQVNPPSSPSSAIIYIANNVQLTGTSGHFSIKNALKPGFEANSAAPSVAAEPDCPGHTLGMSASASADDSSHSSSGCGLCQLCHFAALAGSLPAAIAGLPVPFAPVVTPSSFTSADCAPSQKPPIA